MSSSNTHHCKNTWQLIALWFSSRANIDNAHHFLAAVPTIDNSTAGEMTGVEDLLYWTKTHFITNSFYCWHIKEPLIIHNFIITHFWTKSLPEHKLLSCKTPTTLNTCFLPCKNTAKKYFWFLNDRDLGTTDVCGVLISRVSHLGFYFRIMYASIIYFVTLRSLAKLAQQGSLKN